MEIERNDTEEEYEMLKDLNYGDIFSFLEKQEILYLFGIGDCDNEYLINLEDGTVLDVYADTLYKPIRRVTAKLIVEN